MLPSFVGIFWFLEQGGMVYPTIVSPNNADIYKSHDGQRKSNREFTVLGLSFKCHYPSPVGYTLLCDAKKEATYCYLTYAHENTSKGF
ncbi:hypothetical protein YC2023_035934 [Brassica napus]